VWTNEDMGDVHNHSVISTFSGTSSKPGGAKPAGSAKGGKDAKQYQDQILKLQAKLPPLDEQISELQATLNGTAVNSTRHYSGTKIDDWHEELVHLQKQRDDIATRISALQDEARRNGVPPNQIPE
jgi:septal ring factor EnvC (AmiA/AmiB activator)